jgi:hypothetical protein
MYYHDVKGSNMTLIRTLKTLTSSLFDSDDSESPSISARLERERDESFERLRRYGALPLR